MAAPGTAEAPPRLGEGCLARYDLQAADELGADFSASAALWHRLRAEAADSAAGDGETAQSS